MNIRFSAILPGFSHPQFSKKQPTPLSFSGNQVAFGKAHSAHKVEPTQGGNAEIAKTGALFDTPI